MRLDWRDPLAAAVLSPGAVHGVHRDTATKDARECLHRKQKAALCR